ncbi:DUF262 domain-containing protein [Acidovorax radicis]|uniref:DUF262 domain-containing protein n=1 Tax=Acidovorax radicis TaxID=758826 RepID=UPI0009DA46AC|nr:DUF262 domain-containing protein [Acidovorax radicis]
MDRVEYQSLIIQDILNLHKSSELDLAPWYQRRSVWNNPQKSYLINTLHEQKPIPAVYIRHAIDLEKSKSIREVVDGQQRMRAIISYHANEFPSKHPSHAGKVKFSQLSKDQQQKFLLTSLPVGNLLGATDSDVIDIFGRINSISKSLNDQEKRNAAYSGDMKQFCLAQASSRMSFWRNYGIFSATDISRMNEVLFISDVILNLIKGLSDYSPKALNDLYKEYDEDFPESLATEKRLDQIFDLIASADPRLISDTIFQRQPLFFSLVLAIDQKKKLTVKKISTAIHQIDARFNAEENTTKEDEAFKIASTSTTQRIAQRKIRNSYILSFL